MLDTWTPGPWLSNSAEASNWISKAKSPPYSLEDPQTSIRELSMQLPRGSTRLGWQMKLFSPHSGQWLQLPYALPFLGLPLSRCSALRSTKAPSTYTIWKNTYGYGRSPWNALFTSMWVLSVQRDQLSCEGLPLLLGCLKVNNRAEEGIDQRLNSSERHSGRRRSVLHSGGGLSSL